MVRKCYKANQRHKTCSRVACSCCIYTLMHICLAVSTGLVVLLRMSISILLPPPPHRSTNSLQFKEFVALFSPPSFILHCHLVGNSGHLTWVRHSSSKSSATHSYQCVSYFRAAKQLFGCLCLGFSTCSQMLKHVGAIWSLTPLPPWCHLKTTHKSATFETLQPFCRLFTLACERISIKMHSIKNGCYRTRKYTVGTGIRASLSPESLRAGAVKGLIKPFSAGDEKQIQCTCFCCATALF